MDLLVGFGPNTAHLIREALSRWDCRCLTISEFVAVRSILLAFLARAAGRSESRAGHARDDDPARLESFDAVDGSLDAGTIE